MDRRDFLNLSTKGAIGAATLGLIGCSSADVENAASEDAALPEMTLEMATSWPLSLDTIYGGAQIFSEAVSRLTQGRLTVNPRAAGEIVGGTEVLGAV